MPSIKIIGGNLIPTGVSVQLTARPSPGHAGLGARLPPGHLVAAAPFALNPSAEVNGTPDVRQRLADDHSRHRDCEGDDMRRRNWAHPG
ncbi:hypothetical protein HPB52_022539 [Rhipicephalus sanguineus]|uniref:Uncharacterized protein n=1 Tax=Rhipicephalus sanguineus TaxID=34632 RepID=A0A9D4SXQ7_RHISA|nr:hypothetical protein HPB52_022539 [Rhipicephalus sanguineus]